ncbi:hypothetical protein NLU13_8473 [Sarocladium strictum]|uniref:alpha-1,2-Mannosidase n=1 Tax=Sarocladium strictum TaxID=5046 RepID=A0AA39GC91_SARSR|nr:hypothetical protein NLU13_8473 [Sarocladium strictum]
MMPRRKYRTFILCAVVVLFLLYRASRNSSEEYDIAQPPPFPLDRESDPEATIQRPQALPEGQEPPSVAVEGFAKVEVPDLKQQDEPAPVDKLAWEKEQSRKAPVPQAGVEVSKEPQHPVPPAPAVSSPEQEKPEERIHWVKQPENFPLAKERIRKLPSGTPKTIPKIQFDFPAELAEAKTKRERRLQNITAEIARSWAGYRKHAWMHDELSPVSGEYRDPFCGWAATLVDALDTLWIAGLRDQFDEAAKAVAKIDFTWSPRSDIPVFETTIRYLGGLLAAYDVSGGAKGKYGILLEKATELAEILMGVFDTPNRMPDLYYKWQPEFASQPHRAGIVGIAELGTLSMEFTRLAQLTGANKYYDAIDRITDALIEMQKSRHTSIPGLFPQGIDASGCRKMAKPDPESMSDGAQAQLGAADAVGEPLGWNEAGDVITPVGHAPLDDESELPPKQDSKLLKRESSDPLVVDGVQPRKRPPYSANGEGVDWDCQPQGLLPDGYGNYYYGMGGSQDSAYEYFQKEYLLLGGLEPKYQKLHEDTVEAVDNYLMFRPMIEDDDKWDILFPAKVMSWNGPEDRIFQYEMTHLTCFIGGMYGLGAKIFGREKDLETAKKLTNGCVWAYQLTPSGLMPEAAEILACPTLAKCDFNQTLWEEKLDPSAEWRDDAAATWDEDQEKAKLAEKQAASAGEGAGAAQAAKTPDKLEKEKADLLREKTSEAEAAAKANEKSSSDAAVQRPAAVPAVGGVVKRAAIPPQDTAGTDSQLPDSLKEKLNIKPSSEGAEPLVPHAEHVEQPAGDGDSGDLAAFNGIPQLNVPQKALDPSKAEKSRPMNHEQYVKDRIESEGLRPGMVNVMARAYILRPEAIESVWYMYRITGDPSWQEKGWTMYEATMRATRTELANSAVDNVMDPKPSPMNEMESFWLAETLKYYYLLFAEPDVISLDEWVLNTEAHPFRRPT